MTTSVHVAGPFVKRVTLLDTIASVTVLQKHPSPLCHLSMALAQGHRCHCFSDGWIQRFKGVCVWCVHVCIGMYI